MSSSSAKPDGNTRAAFEGAGDATLSTGSQAKNKNEDARQPSGVIDENVGRFDSTTENKPETNFNSDVHDVHEYPKAWKLVLITIALALGMFCMALVNKLSGLDLWLSRY